MKLTITLFLLLLTMTSMGQEKEVKYLDLNFIKVKKKGSTYISEVYNYGDSLWEQKILKRKGGTIVKIANYSDRNLSKLQSYYQENHENGKKKLCGNFSENKPIGEWFGFSNNGDTAWITNFNINGEKHGIVREYHPNSVLALSGQYIKNRKNGVWSVYFENGILKGKESFNDGERNGQWAHYYQNGAERLSGQYVSGKQEGDWLDRHKNGVRSKLSSYKNGILEGQVREWYNDGTLKSEAHYVNGEKSGPLLKYDEDGLIRFQGICEDGFLGKEYVFFTPDGDTIYEFSSDSLGVGTKNDGSFSDREERLASLDEIKTYFNLIEELDLEDEIFVVVEKMPSFPGGEAALMKYLCENIKYPTIAQLNGIQGRVFIQFVVGKTGELSEITVVRGVDPALDKEAVRVIKAMPNWNPGMQRGKAVNVQFMFPLNFVLN